MTDHNIDPVLDLSPETLAKACKGRVEMLPSFVVHDNAAWPWHNKVRPAKGKLHMRRTTFLRVVVPQIPVRAGLFVRADAQEYYIDLQPHHLQGSTEPKAGPAVNNMQTARIAAKADAVGRLPDEADYRAPTMGRLEGGAIDRGDFERIARDPAKRSIGSAVFSSSLDTELVAMGSGDQ
jgi:hypothetical protein